jgi:hypothetical protein
MQYTYVVSRGEIEDLEALVFKTMTMNESRYVRAEMVLTALQNVVGFYDKRGFKENGPLLRGKLQPMIKVVDKRKLVVSLPRLPSVT